MRCEADFLMHFAHMWNLKFGHLGPITKHRLATCHMLGQPSAGRIERGQTGLWEGWLWAVPWLQQLLAAWSQHFRQTSWSFFAKENLYFVQRGEEDLEVTESSKSIIWGIVPVMWFKMRMGGVFILNFSLSESEGFSRFLGLARNSQLE